MPEVGTVTITVHIVLHPATMEGAEETRQAIETTFQTMLSMTHPGMNPTVSAEIAFTPEGKT